MLLCSAQDCLSHPKDGPSQYAYFAVATAPAGWRDESWQPEMDHIYVIAHTFAEGARVIGQLRVPDRVTALCHFRRALPFQNRPRPLITLLMMISVLALRELAKTLQHLSSKPKP